MTIDEQRTQVVECLRAGRVVPQGLFVELGSLLVVVPAEHRVALVVERRWVVAVGVHGQVGIPVGLVEVFLLSGDKEVNFGGRLRHLDELKGVAFLPGRRGRRGWWQRRSSPYCPSSQRSSASPLPEGRNQRVTYYTSPARWRVQSTDKHLVSQKFGQTSSCIFFFIFICSTLQKSDEQYCLFFLTDIPILSNCNFQYQYKQIVNTCSHIMANL